MPHSKLSDFAKDDLREIWVFIAESDTKKANQIIDKFFNTFQLLADNTEIGKARYELLINLRSFPQKQYVIYYFPTDDGVEIYRILHSVRYVEEVFNDSINTSSKIEEE